MLVVVMLVVLLLVARSWRSVAPTALEVSTPDGEITVSTPGSEEFATNPGGLPNLGEMREATTDHTQQVQEALDQSNQ